MYYPLDNDYNHFYELDIDGDSIADFKFRSERYRGGSGFDYTYAGVYILDPNIEVSFTEKQDTIKRCQTYFSNNPEVLADFTYNNYSGFHCTNSIWDTIYQPQTLIIPYIHHFGDTLINENYTYQEYLPFNYENRSYLSDSYPVFIYKVYQHFWNNVDSSYFVFHKKIDVSLSPTYND